jgi:hypothetical protein
MFVALMVLAAGKTAFADDVYNWTRALTRRGYLMFLLSNSACL